MTTILFIVSLVALCILIASKIFAMKVREINFLSEKFKKGDARIHLLVENILSAVDRYKKISHIFLFDFLPSYTYEILVKMKDYVARRYYEAGTQFRGRRVLKSTGSVSFFLERLSEDKTGIESNKV